MTTENKEEVVEPIVDRFETASPGREAKTDGVTPPL